MGILKGLPTPLTYPVIRDRLKAEIHALLAARHAGVTLGSSVIYHANPHAESMRFESSIEAPLGRTGDRLACLMTWVAQEIYHQETASWGLRELTGVTLSIQSASEGDVLEEVLCAHLVWHVSFPPSKHWPHIPGTPQPH